MPTLVTLAMVCEDVYLDESKGSINGYRRILGGRHQGSKGFFGAAYSMGVHGVIAFRGTLLSDYSEIMADAIEADIMSIGLGKFPIDQLGDSFHYFSILKDALVASGCSEIIITGHSLGGGLTQLVASRITTTPILGVTFNAPGMANLSGNIKLPSNNSANVFNYRSENDPVSLVGAHIGRGPFSIKGGGYHFIRPLIEALVSSPIGRIRY